MLPTHTFPCCAYDLLRHVRSGEIYWFCTNCHQEMPILEHQYGSPKDQVASTKKLFSNPFTITSSPETTDLQLVK